MLVTFRSTATESITMFEPQAVDLLKLMGATGKVPGAFSAADVPAALQRLETAVERLKAEAHSTAARPADNEDAAADEDDEDEQEPPVGLAVRAVPLLSLLKRAAAADAEVMWEGK
jgi:DNA-binding NtrC family response regulator